ncbi:MAG TPA: neutral zinc metallopeptidase [Polyangiales bacterium]
MKWTPGHQSSDVEDRRAQGPASAGLGGGAISILFFLFRRFGVVGVLIGGAALFFFSRFSQSSNLSSEHAVSAPGTEAEQTMVQFVSFVLDDAQTVWTQLFQRQNQRYANAKLVLFREATRSGCGMGQAAMGPFYCPSDRKVYIDLSFYEELKQRFGAPGDFAQAYVITHEIGHHVQHLLGADARVHSASESEQTGATGLSVRLELQADCYAGVWAHSTQQRQLLEAGDIDEALRAAAVIGDDALQRQSQGAVRPETFTHGSSEQRVRWFKRGYESGDPGVCDTFGATRL